MKVLVQYNVIPEEQHTAIVEMTKDEFDYFSKANGYIVNVHEYNDEKVALVNVINQAFCADPHLISYCETAKERGYFGKFVKDMIEDDHTDISDVSKRLVFGFHL